jgi:hypothetical protein
VERRHERRIQTQLPVVFSVLSSGTIGIPREGTILDVSPSGMRIAMDQPLMPGTFLQITLHDSTLLGEVRYCCPFLHGFFVGLLVERVLLGNSDLSRVVAELVEPIASVKTGRTDET